MLSIAQCVVFNLANDAIYNIVDRSINLFMVGQLNTDGKHEVTTEESNGQIEVDKIVDGRKQLLTVEHTYTHRQDGKR